MVVAEYRPQAPQAEILDRAYDFVQSVPYEVSARWLFYRLLQDGLLPDKAAYKPLIALLSTARKRFYKGWRPDTLADDSRTVETAGLGYRSVDEWLSALARQVFSYVDRWQDQEHFVLVCFEAAAMAGQFDHYLPPFVPRVAFKGDVSIPAKWKIAGLIDAAYRRYGLPVHLIYFGDFDAKGLTIPESAVADIQTWARHLFEYERAGLNEGDETRYGIPENPDRPGTYQWEALDDDMAGSLIRDAIEPYINLGREEECGAEDTRRIEAFRDWWAGHAPGPDDLGLDGRKA